MTSAFLGKSRFSAQRALLSNTPVRLLFSKTLSFESRLAVVAVVLIMSLVLVFLGLDKLVASHLIGLGILGAALTGMFYTFGITTPFSMAVILDLMHAEEALHIAFFACIMAATVDCLLFSVVKDVLEANTKELMKKIRSMGNGISSVFPVAGFFVFGLPLPDEIGLALMEMGEIKLSRLWLVVFFSKFLTLIMLWTATSA